MERVTTTVIGTRSNGTKIVRNQITNSDDKNYNELSHKYFTKDQRDESKAKHLALKRSSPFIFNEQRNDMIRSIIDSKQINLNIAKIDIV